MLRTEVLVPLPINFIEANPTSYILRSRSAAPRCLSFFPRDLVLPSSASSLVTASPKFFVSSAMSHSHIPEMSESIDQVIQSGQSLSAFELRNPRESESNVSTNKSNASPPLPPSPSASPSSRSKLSNPRQDQTPFSLRSNPPLSSTERFGTTLNHEERDNVASRKGSSRGEDEASRSSKSETLAGSAAAGNNGMNTTDFFSSEVFQIIIHNPTTAHRFLKFCQTRACGENMEFLQKVICISTLVLLHFPFLGVQDPNHSKTINDSALKNHF
jgi:hypothetical protein